LDIHGIILVMLGQLGSPTCTSAYLHHSVDGSRKENEAGRNLYSYMLELVIAVWTSVKGGKEKSIISPVRWVGVLAI